MTTSMNAIDQQKFANQTNAVPVVHYSLFTEDSTPETTSKSKAVKLEKVVKLLSHPHSATLYERHDLALKKMLRFCRDGFMMRDCLHITKLISMFAERVTLVPNVYLDTFMKLLEIAALPTLKERSSDRLLYHQIYIDLVSQIGYVIRVSNDEVKLQVCKCLCDLYTRPTPSIKYNDLTYNELDYSKSVVEQSDVIEIMAQSLANLGNNLELKLAVLNLLQHLTQSSEICCNKLLNVNGAINLYMMASMDVSANLLFRSIDILWNVLQHGDKESLKSQLSQHNFIDWLRHMFVDQLSKGYSIAERQLRNDILIVITLLAQINPDAPFVETGFVKQLTLLATFQEVKSHNPLVKNLRLSLNHEDFELKKLLINILVVLSDNRAVIPFLEDGQFMLALFTCVVPTATTADDSPAHKSLTSSSALSVSGSSNSKHNFSLHNPNNSIWKPAYQEELQLHALASLSALVPKMLGKFQDICGVNRLLVFLEWCISDDMGIAGYGNAFHAMGGKGNKLAQMRFCMRLILKVVQLNDFDINQEFISEGCISLITTILGNVLKWERSNSTIDMEIQCDMLFILAALCEKDHHAKELFGAEGVLVLIGYLKMCYNIGKISFAHNLPEPSQTDSGAVCSVDARSRDYDPAEVNGIEKLAVATVDAIWGCIVGSYFTEHMFLDKNGAFLMLDLMEMLPAQLRPQSLGCLVDLSENIKALNHLKSWRGSIHQPSSASATGAQSIPTSNVASSTATKDSQQISQTSIQINIAHLLCRFWRTEEVRLNVNRGVYGTLDTNLYCPLIGGDETTSSPNQQQNDESLVEYDDSPTSARYMVSKSILEVSESVRANIYSLLSRLGYLDHPGLQIEDHVTLTIIESYLEFKMGEVWNEIQNEFVRENMRPVSPDQEALEWITRSIEQEGIRVSRVQHELIDAKDVQDKLEEFEFYNQLRENHRQREKNIQHFTDFVERTSNYEKLKEARQNQLLNIEASRLLPQLKANTSIVMHSMGGENIQVTKFCADTIHIDSTPVEIFGGKLATLEKFPSTNMAYRVTEETIGKDFDTKLTARVQF